jgi:hypothetical protein
MLAEGDWRDCVDGPEITIRLGSDELCVQLHTASGSSATRLAANARSLLAVLPELDMQAFELLTCLPNWPYGDDLLLWLIIVEQDNCRLCYMQSACNDEQVVGFTMSEDSWKLIGLDPRHRG